jgi:hypothetical protein
VNKTGKKLRFLTDTAQGDLGDPTAVSSAETKTRQEKQEKQQVTAKHAILTDTAQGDLGDPMAVSSAETTTASSVAEATTVPPAVPAASAASVAAFAALMAATAAIRSVDFNDRCTAAVASLTTSMATTTLLPLFRRRPAPAGE